MSILVEVPFAGGMILVTPAVEHGAQAMAGNKGVIKKAEQSMEDIMSTVKNIGQTMSSSLSELDFDSAVVAFGLSFNGKGQFLVAEASASASLSIKLTFKK
jgi:hypothetical protein